MKEQFTFYQQEIEQLKETGNYRSFPNIPVSLINLSSNDYLGLTKDKALSQYFYRNCLHENYELGAASSRLLTGNNPLYKKLESLLSRLFRRDAALVFNSGYHANIGILPALCQKNDLILADKFVHASLIDGLKLSNCKMMRYRHNDGEHLENFLKTYREDYNNVFILTESIFSMDGDMADLKKLVELKKTYNCLLYVDEAHAFGVRGETGLGCVEELGIIQDVDFIVGTFGKAIASQGAYLICDSVIQEYLINKMRSLIFTTGLPPVSIAWTTFVVERLREMSAEREHLNKLSQTLGKALDIENPTHIIPYVLGENEEAITFCNVLQSAGFHVLPIRYPTVPRGTARARFSLTANLLGSDIEHLSELVKQIVIK